MGSAQHFAGWLQGKKCLFLWGFLQAQTHRSPAQFPLPFSRIQNQNVVFGPALIFKRALQVESGELVVAHREREMIRRTIRKKRANTELEER